MYPLNVMYLEKCMICYLPGLIIGNSASVELAIRMPHAQQTDELETLADRTAHLSGRFVAVLC
jgi:hypothetical protein